MIAVAGLLPFDAVKAGQSQEDSKNKQKRAAFFELLIVLVRHNDFFCRYFDNLAVLPDGNRVACTLVHEQSVSHGVAKSGGDRPIFFRKLAFLGCIYIA